MKNKTQLLWEEPIRNSARRQRLRKWAWWALEAVIVAYLMIVPVAFVLLVLKVTLWPL